MQYDSPLYLVHRSICPSCMKVDHGRRISPQDVFIACMAGACRAHTDPAECLRLLRRAARRCPRPTRLPTAGTWASCQRCAWRERRWRRAARAHSGLATAQPTNETEPVACAQPVSTAVRLVYGPMGAPSSACMITGVLCVHSQARAAVRLAYGRLGAPCTSRTWLLEAHAPCPPACHQPVCLG